MIILVEPNESIVVGVISDTHGTVPSAAEKALQESRLIMHAGDIGGPEVLLKLNAIAPTVAVKGNMDRAPWTKGLANSELVQIGSVGIYMLHDLNGLDLIPETAGIQLVISGHTHCPLLKRQQDVLYLNPGSAGQPRHSLPASIARVRIHGANIEAELIEIK